MLKKISISTEKRNELVDITPKIEDAASDIKDGLCMIYCPHTTAGITINEGADPDVKSDILHHLNKMVPENEGFDHSEGNSDAHIKSSLVGCSETVIIAGGKLKLGTWQKIYFAEFDGPRERNILIKIKED